MAFFTPPVTDQYSMFITSSDVGELLISDQPNITNVTRSVIGTLLYSIYPYSYFPVIAYFLMLVRMIPFDQILHVYLQCMC